jgi:hypothetical protein
MTVKNDRRAVREQKKYDKAARPSSGTFRDDE